MSSTEVGVSINVDARPLLEEGEGRTSARAGCCLRRRGGGGSSCSSVRAETIPAREAEEDEVEEVEGEASRW